MKLGSSLFALPGYINILTLHFEPHASLSARLSVLNLGTRICELTKRVGNFLRTTPVLVTYDPSGNIKGVTIY